MAFGKLPKFKIVALIYGYDVSDPQNPKRWPNPEEMIFYTTDGNAALYAGMNIAYYAAGCVMAIVYDDGKELKRFSREDLNVLSSHG